MWPSCDLGVLAAYGKIIPKDVILNTKYGIFNIHPSLLPKYKGASPVQAAITNGEQTTGVTIIKMDEKLDHGPILSSFREDINPDDTTGSLRERLFQRSAQFVVDLIPNYLSGKIKPKKQDHAKATLTKILKREDGFIDAERFTSEARKVERLIRAMQPWPGAWTYVNLGQNLKKRLKILQAHLENGKLLLDKVQLEGKTPVSFEEFKRGYPDFEFS
ncbi:MAG: Methionyl-tRNA formyltransferase [Candidatus Woesebacteria bacterium GW2011_GWC1_43_10b]|uniref:methionyl-tRNA formyltransferase n=1 Tax=Candidatus Woesebacteria bacterium GW2011_GWC1_43_10b TaxID=1618585 RepID=A0A0G1EZ94_9BACT|nr:MAG: Methionyl-tRNA formyltransferase [Candidatus Woesebacteria bacterium GW2011_GWC1_43_10b]